jgi:hypothetical protein
MKLRVVVVRADGRRNERALTERGRRRQGADRRHERGCGNHCRPALSEVEGPSMLLCTVGVNATLTYLVPFSTFIHHLKQL